MPSDGQVVSVSCPQHAMPLSLAAIAWQVFGGRVVRAPCGVMHGKTSPIHHTGVGLMQARSSESADGQRNGLVVVFCYDMQYRVEECNMCYRR